MQQPTQDEICTFVTKACITTTNEKFYLCSITPDIALRIKQSIPFTLTSYDVIIDEEHVRHVRNRHKED